MILESHDLEMYTPMVLQIVSETQRPCVTRMPVFDFIVSSIRSIDFFNAGEIRWLGRIEQQPI